jgi:hypothetical protein
MVAVLWTRRKKLAYETPERLELILPSPEVKGVPESIYMDEATAIMAADKAFRDMLACRGQFELSEEDAAAWLDGVKCVRPGITYTAPSVYLHGEHWLATINVRGQDDPETSTYSPVVSVIFWYIGLDKECEEV